MYFQVSSVEVFSFQKHLSVRNEWSHLDSARKGSDYDSVFISLCPY